MKFATYRSGDAARVGLVDAEGGRLFDLDAAARRAGAPSAPFASMLALDRRRRSRPRSGAIAGRKARRRGRPLARSRSGRALAPLPEPRQMRDAMSFALHIRQAARGSRALAGDAVAVVPAAFAAVDGGAARGAARRSIAKLPIYYITNRFTVVGPDATVLWPRYSKVMDYELEVGIVTQAHPRQHSGPARPRRTSSATRSSTTFRLATGRRSKWQGRLGPAKGKSFDGSTSLGPWIVTPDELGDPQSLSVAVRVNGETCARLETPLGCCSHSRKSLPMRPRTRRFIPGSFLARALSAIAAASRSAGSSMMAT